MMRVDVDMERVGAFDPEYVSLFSFPCFTHFSSFDYRD